MFYFSPGIILQCMLAVCQPVLLFSLLKQEQGEVGTSFGTTPDCWSRKHTSEQLLEEHKVTVPRLAPILNYHSTAETPTQ